MTWNGAIVSTTRTDQYGVYSFLSLSPGDYTITENALGYEPTTVLPVRLTLGASEVAVAEEGMADLATPGQIEIVNTDLIIGNDVYERTGPSWSNPGNPNNVDNSSDGLVTPADVLVLLNFINANAPDFRLPDLPAAPPPYYDVNDDGFVTAADALLVINFINRVVPSGGSPEGEANEAVATVPASEPVGQALPDLLFARWFAARHTDQAEILRSSTPGNTATDVSPSSTDPVRPSVDTSSLVSTIEARDVRESPSDSYDEFALVESVLPVIVEDINGVWNQT